ncbi:histidine phosphatase family protein [Loigolactobacillus binensis]|uniref:Histidine phosphatase family protein n=1 Tax=Loigolactobacillus binensis TaxID=2559922 RepID=A0ABW3ED34_9LACO|nr:histidine phosphatase family protein [Loigolactobacillus binensis]
MTELYFIRHGQTIINQEGKVNGATVDTPLTAAGISGAQAAGRELATCHFDHVFVSPQKRAQATAQLVLANNPVADIQVVEQLHEMAFGDWEGRLIADGKKDPALRRFFTDPEHYDPSSYHGETFAAVVARGQAFLQHVVTTYPHQRVLVVGHGTMLTVTVRSALGASIGEIMTQAQLDNTSISVLQSDNGTDFTLARWNDTSFLTPAIDRLA